MMKICHFATTDAGGAGIAMRRLNEGLKRIGVDSSVVVAHRQTDDPAVREEPLAIADGVPSWRSRRIGIRHAKMSRDQRPDIEGFSDVLVRGKVRIPHVMQQADVINLHWTAWKLDWKRILPRLIRSKGLVWTLHDMNPFTGGCHYDQGCGRFTAECDECPLLRGGSSFATDILHRKLAVSERLNGQRVHIAAPSRWIASEARRSRVLQRFKISCVGCGLDLDVFVPVPVGEARQMLDLPANVKIVAFVAEQQANPRKGFDLLLNALPLLCSESPVVLLTVGAAGTVKTIDGLDVVDLGRIEEPCRLRAVYSAADVFVLPSRQEVLGQTGLEAIACGTPVAAFNVGGIPDYVIEGQTGSLAESMDPGALADSISRLIHLPAGQHAKMRLDCRRFAEKYFSLEANAAKYLKIYSRLCRSP